MFTIAQFCRHYGYRRGSDSAADAYAAYRRTHAEMYATFADVRDDDADPEPGTR